MKKKIVAILLCVFIIGVLSISLVACNPDEEQADPIIGTWVGYKQGDDSIQYFLNCYELETSNGKQLYASCYKAKIINDQLVVNTTAGDIRISNSPNVYRIGFDMDSVLVGDNSTNYGGDVHKVELIDERLNITLDWTGAYQPKYIFKRTDLTADDWRSVSIRHETDPKGNPIVDSDNNYIYIPYFYEQ